MNSAIIIISKKATQKQKKVYIFFLHYIRPRVRQELYSRLNIVFFFLSLVIEVEIILFLIISVLSPFFLLYFPLPFLFPPFLLPLSPSYLILILSLYSLSPISSPPLPAVSYSLSFFPSLSSPSFLCSFLQFPSLSFSCSFLFPSVHSSLPLLIPPLLVLFVFLYPPSSPVFFFFYFLFLFHFLHILILFSPSSSSFFSPFSLSESLSRCSLHMLWIVMIAIKKVTRNGIILKKITLINESESHYDKSMNSKIQKYQNC